MKLEERLRKLEKTLAYLNDGEMLMRTYILKHRGGEWGDVTKALFSVRAAIGETEELILDHRRNAKRTERISLLIKETNGDDTA